MKKLIYVILGLALLGSSYAADAQKYDPSNGTTTYSNGTVYVPLTTGDNPRESPVVVSRNSDGTVDEVADCKYEPARCRELLEEAADAEPEQTAEGEEKKEKPKQKSFMAEPGNVEEWQDLFKQMHKGKTGPIFFHREEVLVGPLP